MEKPVKTMRGIAVVAPGEVRVVDDLPVPVPGAYDVLVKNVAVGFCNGTDFQIINNTLPKFKDKDIFPAVLGHEAAGRAVAVGEKVRNIKVGDCFIRPHYDHPGNGYSCAYGNMAEYGIVSDQAAMLEDGIPSAEIPFYKDFLQIPADFDLVDCGVLLSLLECYSAIKNFGITEGMDILAYGCGPMGLAMQTLIKNTCGANSLIAIDSDDSRLRMAAEIAHADETVNFAKQDVEQALKGRKFDVVLDAVGSAAVITEGSWRLKPGGKIAGLGVIKPNDLLDITKMQNNVCLHILNEPYQRFDAGEEVIKLIREGRINMKDFYSHVLPLEEIRKGMDLIREKKALKVIFKF